MTAEDVQGRLRMICVEFVREFGKQGAKLHFPLVLSQFPPDRFPLVRVVIPLIGLLDSV